MPKTWIITFSFIPLLLTLTSARLTSSSFPLLFDERENGHDFNLHRASASKPTKEYDELRFIIFNYFAFFSNFTTNWLWFCGKSIQNPSNFYYESVKLASLHVYLSIDHVKGKETHPQENNHWVYLTIFHKWREHSTVSTQRYLRLSDTLIFNILQIF